MNTFSGSANVFPGHDLPGTPGPDPATSHTPNENITASPTLPIVHLRSKVTFGVLATFNDCFEMRLPKNENISKSVRIDAPA